MVMRRTFLAGMGAMAALPAAAQTPAVPAAAPTPATPAAPAGPPPVPAGAVRIRIATGAGPILVDLYADKAPITCRNFLKYVDGKLYDNAYIYRAVKVAGEPLFGLVQGGLHPTAPRLKPIAHESTALTGLSNTDGAISMAREAPGTATSDFFFCVGDASGLDFDPKTKDPGFAAFGKVVQGMDIVKKILLSPTAGAARTPSMKGQILTVPVAINTMRRL